MKTLPLLACLCLVAANLPAQSHASTEVHSDRTVTFRYRAPLAKEVRVRSEALKQLTPLKKNDQGVWSMTTEPLEPDIYVYAFEVDEQRVLDPSNPLIKYNLFATENQLHVPGPKKLAWEINDVPHGVLHRHHYRSEIIGDERDVWIYTPPGYDPAQEKKYPVLYLLHGFSDAEDTWVSVGRANVILDNLIARGMAKPMLIVMPRGYGNREITANGWDVIRNRGGQHTWADSNAKFGESLRKEIVPFVEKHYRVATDRESRAIAGLSMGGTQSLLIGLNAPEQFAWIASFSAGGLPAGESHAFAGVGEKLNDQLRLLWIGCGTEDGLITNNQRFVESLQARGVRHTWIETPGGHSFMLWRRYLADVLPLLFVSEP